MIRTVCILFASAAALAQGPESLLRQGKYTEAAAQLEVLREQRPNDPEVLLALGICYSETGQPAEAAAALRKHLAIQPRSADGRAVLGIVLLAMGRIGEARPELERAVSLDPSQLEAAKALARVDIVSGSAVAAANLMRAVGRAEPQDEEARLLLGRALLKSGDPRAAGLELDRLLAASPRSGPEVYLLAASARKSLGDMERAFEICESGMRIHPYSERLESFYASLPLKLFAARTERRLERMNPNDPGERLAVGRVMINIEKSRNAGAATLAEKLLAGAVALSPVNAAAHHYHGRSLLALSKTGDAVVEFRAALAADPDDELKLLIYTWLGRAEARLSQSDAAEKAFRAAMDLNRKRNPHLVDPAFQYYRFLKDSSAADAQRMLDEILRWEPFNCPALLERAKQLAAEGHPEQAAEQAELALRNMESMESNDLLRTAHFFLARTYHGMGRDEQARVHEDWMKMSQPHTGGAGRSVTEPQPSGSGKGTSQTGR